MDLGRRVRITDPVTTKIQRGHPCPLRLRRSDSADVSQIVEKNAPSRNVEESFEKFLDPDQNFRRWMPSKI